VRVAGNVLGAECIGSLEYAVDHLHALRLLLVLGHTGCGAVTAAVEAYLDPARYLATAPSAHLRSVVDALLVGVGAAATALDDAHGPGASGDPARRSALVDAAVAVNAAVGAGSLRHELRDRLGERLDVVYGVYDLSSRTVVCPGPSPEAPWVPGLERPPDGPAQVRRLAERAVGR
jgi:carbonic anhydrase